MLAEWVSFPGMWITTKTNGCFTLQTGNGSIGEFHLVALFTEPEMHVEARVRAWDFRENPFPFHFRSISASVSRANPLWFPRDYWPLTCTSASALDWCFCQNHGKCTKESKDRAMECELYFSALAPLTYAVHACPGCAQGRGEGIPRPAVNSAWGLTISPSLLSFPVCPPSSYLTVEVGRLEFHREA